MKKWNIKGIVKEKNSAPEKIMEALLRERGITSQKDIDAFFHPKDPVDFTPDDVKVNKTALKNVLLRIKKAIQKKESMVIYADYDADGITAGAILWETLYALGAKVMPYIPHRKEEGYGFSEKGLDTIKISYNPSLVISVDHGVTAHDFVAYAKTLRMEVIVTDHHLKPEQLPECLLLHTTALSGAGVAFFLATTLISSFNEQRIMNNELLSLAAIGTIADMVPLVGPNRSIAKYGLEELNKTKRVGLVALIKNAGLIQGSLTSYSVSHMIAPRLNAMGRLTHALDALRLLCTKKKDRAEELAKTLGLTNTERQQMTSESVFHAKGEVLKLHGKKIKKKLLVISHASYNQGIIGLVAGKLAEEHFRPAIVISVGELISKASARSIPGFNIVEAIRNFQELLIDVGGHPLAAGFTIETKHIAVFQEKLEQYADAHITDDMLERSLYIDLEVPLTSVSEKLWEKLKDFEPYGLGNPEPVFATRGVKVTDVLRIGAEQKHLKMRIQQPPINLPAGKHGNQQSNIDAIAFNQGGLADQIKLNQPMDIVYTIDRNEWYGKSTLQLKIKDIH
jgi:single-stranded-DNA-specific exonuclease